MNSDELVESATGVDDLSPLLLHDANKKRLIGRNTSLRGDEPEWPGQRDFDGLPWWKKPSIFWLIPPYALFTLAFGGIVVPKLNLIKEMICRDYYADRAALDPSLHYIPIQFGHGNDQCRIKEVQSRATQFMLIGSVISGCISALTSPKLGAMSDRYGRKKIIAFATIGGLTGEVITILAASKPETFAIQWLFLSFFIDGLCGSFTTGMAVSHAYATDCTPPSRRNVAFGYFHGMFFIGIAIGPLLAGLVVKATGTLLSMFYIALGCHLFFLFCILFVVPESLTKARQLAARQKYAESKKEMDDAGPGEMMTRNGLYYLTRKYNPLEPLKVLYPTGPGTSPALRRNMVLLAAIDTTMFAVGMGSYTVVTYYTDWQFHWDTTQQSYFMSIVNICRVSCLFVVLPIITRLFRGKFKGRRQSIVQSGCDQFDLNLIRCAVFFDTLGYLGYTTVRTGGLFILCGCVAAFGGIGSPTLQSALTKHVPHDRVGQLLGANGLLHSLARIVAPIIFNTIYSKTVGNFPQTVFLCLTIGFGSAFIMSLFVKSGVYLPQDNATRSTSSDGIEDYRD